MLRKRLLMSALISLVVLLVAGLSLAQDGSGTVRFVHAIPGAAPVDIHADGTMIVSNLESGESSLFVTLPPGSHNLTVTQAGSETMLWEQPLQVASDSAQTLIVASTQPLLFQPYVDDLAPLALGTMRFTAIHAIPDGPAVDVVLSDGRQVIANLSYGQTYGTLDLPALSYELAVVPTGEGVDSALVPVQTYPLQSGVSYALMISGTADEPQATLLAAPAGGEAGSGWTRVAHAVPGGDNVDVYFGETLVVPNLAYGETSEYLAVPAASYDVIVREAGSADTVLATSTADVAADTRQTLAVILGDAGVTVQSLAADTSALTTTDAVINLVNAIPGESTAFLSLSDGSGLTGDIPSGESSAATVPATEGGARVSITSGGEPVDVELPLDAILGGVFYEIISVQGETAPEALLLEPVAVALGSGSLPGAAVVVQATPEVTAETVVQEPTAAPPAETTPETTPADATLISPEVVQPTATLAAPEQTFPTARVLLDPGANLQLRQEPSSTAFSLGLAPSGSTLIVLGREGAPEFGPFETPQADATEFVDPVTLLAEGDDLNPVDTWIFVVYNTPDGGSIEAWVNAGFVGLSNAQGQAIGLRILPTVPSNRTGQALNTSMTVATRVPPQVLATVGGLDEGVNLQIRRTPETEGESLTLVPAGTQLELIGFLEDQSWAFVRFVTESGEVSGWVNTMFLITYTYQDQPISIDGMMERSLVEIVPPETRGRQAGEVAAPAAPTRDPLRSVVVATVNQLSEGVNLQLRRQPNVQAESLGLIPSGAQVVVQGRTDAGDWLFVEWEEVNGWIASEYVALSFNGLPHNLMDLPVTTGPISVADRTATAVVTINAPTPEPTAVTRTAEIVVDTVGMTVEPGGEGGGLPVLARGRLVEFIWTTNDMQFSFIRLEDGTVGWVPSYAVLVLE